MNIFTRTFNKMRGKLPGIRRPNNHSLYGQFLSNYGWTTMRSDKPHGEFEIYYQALHNVYVHRCIQVEIDMLLATGFNINNLDEETINLPHKYYLQNLFKNPEGQSSEVTYPMFHSQYIRSFEGTGDAFIELNHEEVFQRKVPTGFRYVPSELIRWYPDTEQWGYRNRDIRYETDELIHIYEPDITLKGSKWGMCKIDKIGLAIAIMFLGMKYNKKVLENDGLDPKAILSFDKDMDYEDFIAELQRLEGLKAEQKKGATLALKGAVFSSAGNSNRDMDWNVLLEKSRDMIITAFGSQPALVGVIETANLGTGSGETQKKNFKDTLSGRASIIEGAFNKALGHEGFQELFQFNELDLEDKLQRAQIEDIRLKNGSLSINEVRSKYGEEPVPWGNAPMNYQQFGLAPSMQNMEQLTSMSPTNEPSPLMLSQPSNEVEILKKALLLERLQNEY